MSNAYQTMGQAPFAMLADVVRGYKQKGAREQQQQELSQILTNPEGGAATREGIMGRMAQSQNPQLQNMALAMMLKQPKTPDNPFGGSLDANLLNIALTGDVNDPRTRMAYQQLGAPKKVTDAAGTVTFIEPSVPAEISARFETQAPAVGGESEGMEGFEEVAPGIQQKKAEKPAPVSMVNAYQSNVEQERKLMQISDALDDPEKLKTLGPQNVLPGVNLAYQLFSPESTDVRGLIAGLQSMTYKDISGANVTATEEVRLQPYVPNINDLPEVAKQKAKLFLKEYQAILNDQEEIFRSQGYKLPALRGKKEEQPKLSPKDQEALDWANANPNDPRAAQIKANLGM